MFGAEAYFGADARAEHCLIMSYACQNKCVLLEFAGGSCANTTIYALVFYKKGQIDASVRKCPKKKTETS